MAKALNVSLAVTADTSQAKAQLQSLQSTLTQLTSNSANLKIGLNANELKEASAAVTELGVHLKQATNADTGTLNFAKLSTSIKSSGMSLKEYGAQLLRLGPQGQQAFTQLASSIARAEVPIKRLSGLLGNMGTVLANTIRWQVSSSIIHGFMSSVSQAFSYAQDLNKSLTDIQIVTQASDEHMAKFAESANKAAKQLSTTTTAYTKASLIYYQQGLNDQQVKERTDVTVKMANVTGQSAKEVSDQLTAIWNNFAKGGDNLEYYADVITALGAATASSSEEISKGLEKFAAIADTVGLSYENATAALATITATTRQSADSVGTGLRTLFSRLQSLSLGETLEDGVNLTKYSKALKTIGVDVLDATGNLREMDDILEDMGAQWDKLTDAQKTATAQTVGGVRQYTTLMALMENFDFYKQNQKIAENSAGTVQKQQEIYEKSWKASQDRVKASAESIYSNLISDKFFISLNNGFAKFLDIINNIIEGLGGLKGVLTSVGAIALKLFSNEAATGLVNFSNNIKTMFANPTTLRKEQADFISWGADQLAGRGATEQESAFARHQLELQAAYAKNAMKMTSTDRMVAQAHIDNYTRNREEYSATQRSLEQSRDRAGDLRSALVSQSEARRMQAAVNQYNKTGVGGDPYLQKAAKQGYLDFQGGKFSFKAADYYKDLGKALDTNLVKPLTNFEKQKDILKNWADDSSEGIKKLGQELEKAGLTDAEKFLEGAEDGSFLKGGKEELIQSLKDSTEGNIQENITNLTDQWGFSTETVEKYRAAIQAAAGDEQKLAAIVKQMAQDEQNAANATNKKNKQMQTAEGITSLAQGMMSIGAASSSLQGIVSTIQQISEGAISAGDAFTSLTSGIGSMVMMGVMGFNALSAAAAAFNIALSTGPLIAITAIMVLLPTIIKAIENAMPETNEEKITRLAEAADKAQASANESKQAYDNLLSNVSSHNELLTEINSLTAGTKEFTEALQEANIIASGLISTYGLQLGKDYTFENGKITFNEDSIKAVTEAAQNWSYLQEFSAGLAQYQYSSQNSQIEREDQRWDRTNGISGWADTHVNEADFITQVQSSIRSELGQMYYDNQANFEKLGITQDEFLLNTNLYQHSMDEIQSYLNSFDFLADWTDGTWGLTRDNIFSTALDKYWSGEWGSTGYAWGSDEVVGAYGSWQNLLDSRESIINPSRENTVAGRTFGQDQYTQLLTSIANFQDGISDAEGFAIEALTDAFNTDEFDSMMSEIENAEDLNFTNIADAKDKFAKELSAEQLKLLENDEEYQKLDEKGKIQKLKDTIILNRKRQAIEKQFASEVAQFENTNILNKYADLENQTLSELSEINTEGLNSDEISQLTKLQNSYRGKIEKAANQVLKAAFGEDTEFKPEDWDITAKDWLKAQDLFSSFSSLFKKDFEDTSFSQKMGELLFNESTKQINQGLLSALSSVDTSSNLSALLDLKRYSGFSQFSGVSSELNQLYETGLEAIGGKAGILEELYGTAEFQDSLKDLQKQFKKTGKISSQNILDAADSCEILNDVLENTELSAGAIAGAIELMSTGAVSSISEISNAVLEVLGTINAFADSLANAFKYIDEWDSHLDRSTQDLSDHFSKISKDIFELLGEGNVGGERLYQQLTGMFGEQYAAGMRQFFIDQETGANKDNPEARQKAYNERYGEIDKWIQQAQKEGNNRALWEGMLSGAMDSEITGLSERLQGAGLSLGEGNDIELDTQGRTTTQMQAALAQAMGIDFDAAGVWLQELAGHSASITQDLKTNDYLAAASQVTQLEGADRNLANLALARTTDQTTIDAARARLEEQRAEAQRTVESDTTSEADRASAEATLAEIEAQEAALREVEEAHEDIAADQETILENAGKTEGIYEQLSDTSKEVSQNMLNTGSKTATVKNSDGSTQQEMTNVQQLMDYYESLGMSAEQAWETTKQAYQTYADEAGDSAAAFGITAEDAYGNVIGVALDAEASLEDLNEAQKQLAIDMKHSENQELGKDLFKGMVAAAAEMQGSLQEISGIDAVVNLTVDADTSAAEGKIAAVAASAEGTTGTITIDGDSAGAESAAESAAAYADGLTGTVTVEGNTGPFESAMASILHDYSVNVNVNLTGISSGAIITAATNAARARYSTKALGGLVQSNAIGSANRSVAPGISLTAEEGPEVVWNKNDGYAYLVGGNGHPEFVALRPGDRVFNANQTREILNYHRPDSNYFNSILKPENMDQKLFGSFAEGSAYGSYGPSSRYGSGGGGSGGAGKTKDFTPERYHVIKRQIQDLEFWYDELAKAREKAYGTNILEAIDDEIKATDELLKAQQALVAESEKYKNEDLSKLQKLSEKYGFKLDLDENGNIRNWDDLQAKYAEKAANKDETAKEIWDAIKQYEETLDEWQADYSKMTDLMLQKAELQLERITQKREMKIEFDEKEIKLLDFYIKRIEDSVYNTAQVIDKTSDKFKFIRDQADAAYESIDSVFEKLVDRSGKEVRKADGSSYTLEDWINMSKEERDALDINYDFGKELEESYDIILESLEAFDELKTDAIDRFSEAFTELDDHLETTIGLFDHYKNLLSTLQDIGDLQGVKLAPEMEEVLEQINNNLFNNIQNTIAASQKEYLFIQEQKAQLQEELNAMIDRYGETDTRVIAAQKQLEEYEDRLNTLEENMVNSWQEGLSLIQEWFNSTMDKIVKEYETSISNMYETVNEFENAWDQQKKNDNFYVKDYEKYYQISKLQRSINKDLEEAAKVGNKQNERMKRLYQELNDARANGAELTAYDLDIFAKRYEYEKALMDLEDARNNKNEVRLQRDANGNWGYVYTNAEDDSDLIAKQQKVEDTFYELQKASQDRLATLSDDMMSQMTGVGNRLKELYSSGASQDVIQEYLNQVDKSLNNTRYGIKKALQDAGMTEDEAKLRYGAEGFDILDKFNETLLSSITGEESLEELMRKLGISINTTDSQMQGALDTYNERIAAINSWFEENGQTAAEAIGQMAANIDAESKQNLANVSTEITTAKDILDQTFKAMKEYHDKWDIEVGKIENRLDDILTALHQLNSIEIPGPESNAASMDSGGYTGSWGASGKLAILHEKENVFDQHDTQNLLDAAMILRTIDLSANLFSRGLGSIITPLIAETQSSILDQNVHIDATFPNVTDHNEIELAFDNLINKASQYANRKNMSAMTFQDTYTSSI